MSKQIYILSVCIRSHNQREFIRDALNSVLAQRTSFPFEIIISDDHSEDGTVEILKQYELLYPEKITLLLGEVNIGGPANLRRVIEASSSKYITCLDGDDYYLDEYKLQKQVDFLENYKEYSACFHNTLNVKVDGTPISLFNSLDFPSVLDAKAFIQEKWFIPIHSAMLRREYIFFPEWYDSVMNDDYVVHLSVVKNAPYYYRPDIMVAYRHHKSNSSIAYLDKILTATKLRDILIGFSTIYPNEYHMLFQDRIDEYNKEIAFWNLERKFPWRKFFRVQTYKQYIKRLILR